MVESFKQVPSQIEPFFFFGCVGSQLWHMGSSLQDLCWVMWDPPPQPTDSQVVVCGLSCSVACGVLVPQPVIEPMSSASYPNQEG